MLTIDSSLWGVILVNILTSLPAIIIAIATLIKVVKTKSMVNGKMEELKESTKEAIRTEAVIIEKEAQGIRETAAQLATHTASIVNGDKVLRAPRRATDPVPLEDKSAG